MAGPGGASGWETNRPDSQSEFLDLKKETLHEPNDLGRWPANIYACPKASRGEREAECDELPERVGGSYEFRIDGSLDGKPTGQVANNHPTVKPVKLMRWLVRLVTPPGGTVVEPFCGSGTTLIAAEAEGVTCLAAEMEPAYCDIIRARFEEASNG